VKLLAFDEMQITDITDAMIVGRLFQLLTEAGVVIVTTSNRPPEDLYKNGLNRGLFLPFIDYLNTRFTVHQIESATDHRQPRRSGRQAQCAAADSQAARAVGAIWSDLTGGGRGSPLTLSVNGREVVIERVQGGVARAGFWDVCGKPLGPGDYLAIASA